MKLFTVWLLMKHCFSLNKDTTPPQPNHTVTPTRIEPEQYNTWNKSTISRKLLEMDVLTFETCWAVNSEIIKQVTLVYLCSIIFLSLNYSIYLLKDSSAWNYLRCGSWWSTASACIRIPHHTSPAKPQRNTNTHRTRTIQPMK